MEWIMDTKTSFGRWLRQRRRVLDLTQQELARQARCSVGTIRKIEVDQRRPSKAIANRLADCLGIAAADLPTFIVFARTAPSSKRPAVLLPGEPLPAQILTTKLYVPRTRPTLVPRPRLTERLNAGLSGMLTLIAAPAGFGKTTLLSDWLPTAGRPAAWLALDAEDNDLSSFLHYLVAALQTIAPAIGNAALALLRSPQAPAPEALITALLNDIAGPTDGAAFPPSILVLADYHVITAPPVQQAAGFLVEHLPPQLHLVIACRAKPELPLARLRARGQLCELRADQLRFTAEEARTFLTKTMGLPLVDADVAALEERFNRQPPHIQIFLLQTSILDRLCGPLCDAVVGREASDVGLVDDARRSSLSASSQLLLEQLERANLFLIPLDDERQWYRYHHLFSEVLRKRLTHGGHGDFTAALHRRASTWYEQQGLIAEAVQHALAAGATDQAARLVEQASLTMMQRSELQTLQRWIEALPTDLVRARPWLALRRWDLPHGTLTLLLTTNTALMWAMKFNRAGDFWVLLLAAFVAGLVGDVLLGWLKPSVARLWALRVFAFSVPFALVLFNHLALIATAGLWWKIHMWLGVPFVAGVGGLLLSFVSQPPAIPQTEA